MNIKNNSRLSKKKPIRVIVVDGSSLVRNTLDKGLSNDPDIEVVATAADAYIARDKIVELKPDVLTLDVEIPRMDGVEFLRRLMPQYPLPVVMVSSLTQKGKQITLDALEAGAIDFVFKPVTDIARGLNDMMMELKNKIKIAARANIAHLKTTKKTHSSVVVDKNQASAESSIRVIAIGSSTGGVEAIRKVVTRFPASMPGVVIVQHMPAGFTRLFANRLNGLCAMKVKEAQSDDRIIPGRILIAPGKFQMTVARSGGVYRVICKPGLKVNNHCPSVDVLFHSVAKNVGANAVGIILTGMGHDGSEGMLAMRKMGSVNFAQDKASSIVFGMPKEAFDLGGVECLLPIDKIAPKVIGLFSKRLK